MWYFSWVLGVGLALTFGVLNAIWYEVEEPQGGAGEANNAIDSVTQPD
jgi:cytochrome bd-I ubiquinol oxidase subunit X